MSEQQVTHTPGPWKLIHTDKWPVIFTVESAGGSVILSQDQMCHSSAYPSYAWAMCGAGMGSVAECIEAARVNRLQEANLRLIAAAPDMLVALQNLLAMAERELADPEDVAEIAIAREAIAKATPV